MVLPTIKELAASNEQDVHAKTQGLIDLLQAQEHFSSGRFPFKYSVPASFSVRQADSFTDAELEAAVTTMMGSELHALLVRSDHRDEEPGQFESFTAVYNPEDISKSLDHVGELIAKQLAIPGMNTIVQRMAGKVATITTTDENWKRIDKKVIGDYSVGIVGRSHSHLNPSEGLLSLAFGLPTKLVDAAKSDDICLIPFNDYMGILQPVYTATNHAALCASVNYKQNNQDLFDVESGELITIRMDSDGFSGSKGPKVRSYTHNTFMPGYGNRVHHGLVTLLYYFAEKLDRPVEIEALDSRMGTEIFQLTRSHLLESVIEKLTDVPTEKIIFQTDREQLQHHANSRTEIVLGSLTYEGPVIVTNGYNTSALEHRVKAYNGEVLVIGPGFYDEIGAKASVNFDTQQRILNDQMHNQSYHAAINAHIMGFLTSQIYKKQKKGTSTCAVVAQEPLYGALEYLAAVQSISDEGLAIIDNAKVEAVGGRFQLFL